MKVGIVGATGQVGTVMRSILAERKFPADELRLFASARSAGSVIEWQGREITVEDAATADYTGLDIVLFSAAWLDLQGARREGRLAGRRRDRQLLRLAQGPRRPAGRLRGQPARRRGPPQGHHRQPELHHDGRHARAAPAARGGGARDADRRHVPGGLRLRSGFYVAELHGQASKVVADADKLTHDGSAVDFPEPGVYKRPIAFNVLPLALLIVDDGSFETDEEQKLRNESRKILEIPELKVSGTCVRVPVFSGHSLQVNARFARPVSVERAYELLKDAPGVELSEIPTPLQAAGKDASFVGRIRNDETVENGLAFFVSNDNLRKGAALNAVQIAELVAAELRG